MDRCWANWHGDCSPYWILQKIIVGDKNIKNAKEIARIMTNAGFDIEPVEGDIFSRTSILNMITIGQKYGEISTLINSAGVSPSQASIEIILKVDLYGTAVLLEEVGKVIKSGGRGEELSGSTIFYAGTQYGFIFASSVSDDVC